MKRFNHSVLIPERSVTSDGVEQFDLPVNPLSMVLINIRPLNETSTLTNFARYLQLCDSLNAIRVYREGAAVANIRGSDLAACNYFRHGICPAGTNETDTDNVRRSVVLPLLFGRFPYDQRSCLPESKRGDLTMELDIDVADTGYDGFQYSIETVELLDAKPKEYERKITINSVFGATGDFDVSLPSRSKLRGVLVNSSIGFSGASPAPTAGRLRVLADNQEFGYQSTDFETSRSISSVLGRFPFALDDHIHRVNAASASATEPTTAPRAVGGVMDLYTYLEFDPTRDDEYSLDLSKFNSSVLRLTAETAGTVRTIPVEGFSI